MEAAYLKERSDRLALEKEKRILESRLNITMGYNVTLQNEIER
jgi:hypothetical protein